MSITFERGGGWLCKCAVAVTLYASTTEERLSHVHAGMRLDSHNDNRHETSLYVYMLLSLGWLSAAVLLRRV